MNYVYIIDLNSLLKEKYLMKKSYEMQCANQ